MSQNASGRNVIGLLNRTLSVGLMYRVVALVALWAHAVSMLATPLWVYPDSVDYIELAGGLSDRGDWSHELFLIRPPGYPVLLAIIFKLFGAASPVVLQVVQHLMGVAMALVTAALALRVTGRPTVALIAGGFCSLSLQVLAYCNLPLTEIPFTLTVLAALYLLVGYWQAPHWKLLAACSALGGAAYMIKPIGVLFVAFGAMVAVASVWRDADERAGAGVFVFMRRGLVAVAVATVPALLVATPWLIQSAYAHSSSGTSRCLDYVFYLRPLEFDRLDTTDTQSAAMHDIHVVVAEAIDRGYLPPDADFRDRLTVIQAYQRTRGLSFAESTKLLGQAGRDVMREHPRSIALNTVKYMAWMLLTPDPVYRFVPGGAPGSEGRRARSAELYAISTYSVGPGSWQPTLAKHVEHLPLSVSAGITTGVWRKLVSAFFRRIDRGPSPIGMRDSPYELLILFCLLGGALSVWRRGSRSSAILVLWVLLYIGVSAFFAGPQTRYVVAVKPLIFIWGAILWAGLADAAALGIRRVAARRSGPAAANPRQQRCDESVSSCASTGSCIGLGSDG